MKIMVTISTDDSIAFARYHSDHQPFEVEHSRVYRILIVSIGVLLCVQSALMKRTSIWAYLPGVVIAVFGLLYNKTCRWFHKGLLWVNKFARKECDPVEYEIGEDGFLIRVKNSESRVGWDGIREIVSVEDRTFVYVGSEIAHIIPRSRLDSTEYEDFVTELKRRWEQRENAAGVTNSPS